MKAQKQTNEKKVTPLITIEKTRAGSGRKTVGSPTPAERSHMIAEAAYYMAEQRGFQGGSPQDDWLQAEKTIEAQMRGK